MENDSGWKTTAEPPLTGKVWQLKFFLKAIALVSLVAEWGEPSPALNLPAGAGLALNRSPTIGLS